jgi:hypothetical protein
VHAAHTTKWSLVALFADQEQPAARDRGQGRTGLLRFRARVTRILRRPEITMRLCQPPSHCIAAVLFVDPSPSPTPSSPCATGDYVYVCVASMSYLFFFFSFSFSFSFFSLFSSFPFSSFSLVSFVVSISSLSRLFPWFPLSFYLSLVCISRSLCLFLFLRCALTQ